MGVKLIDETADGIIVLKAVYVADFQRLIRIVAKRLVNVRFAIVIQLRVWRGVNVYMEGGKASS